MSQWKPIDTAPKDGSTFLVFIPGNRRPIQTAWENVNGVMAVGGVFSFDIKGSPTHWHPLPSPPTQDTTP